VPHSDSPRPGTRRDGDPRWAELADLALVIAREIQFLGYRDPAAIPLTQTEGTVMRYVNGHDGAAPSQIADATGLQRTNLATVLTGLQRKGLIERRASPQDGRAATIHGTDRGRANYALVRGEARSHDLAFVEEITAAYRDAFTAAAAEVKDAQGRVHTVQRGRR